MKTLTPEQLNTILEDHSLWLKSEGGKRADLRDADLNCADLNRADLRDANLSFANLNCADLNCADLNCADLNCADLNFADLREANLREANLSGADLYRADLSGAGLRRATMWGALLSGTNLSGADLTDTNWGENIPVIENIHQKVYAAASKEGALDMTDRHHECGTTHCRAGWIVTLAGERGRELEKETSTDYAALAIYAASDPAYFTRDGIPDFFASNEVALADMKRLAELEASQ